ncbi:MuDR family transposase [Rhynchospora pubera]|uniref:MuDR family transposase n=1 Tax=Rhynchospora pubera TaxID=906938 RepID=A0AAV8DZS3_9POAL|nr:MuDR family transposase [Rhynchospora pubera]
MFPISIYTGGAVEHGPMGVTYNKPPLASYPAQEDITFDELKRTIYQLTGINEDKNSIIVNARWKAGPGSSHCFVLLPISENSMWRMLAERTISGATGWSIVELFVEAVPNSCCTQNDPGEKSQSNVECGEKTPEHPVLIGFGTEEDQEEQLPVEEEEEEEEEESQELTDEQSIDDEEPLYVGRMFDSKDDLKQAVIEYHIKQNREVETIQSGNTKYVVKCLAPKCKWRLYAKTKDRNYCAQPTASTIWMIMTMQNEHVCSNKGDRGDHVNMSAEFISRLILDLIKKRGDACTVKEIQEFVHEQYQSTPSIGKAWRAKELALAHFFGEWKESYAKLAPYLNAIQVANPGTKVEWWSDATADPKMRYLRGVAWAFAPAIEGFKQCRPVISVDSTILCGKYGGRMLIAVAYDAEDQLLPLAFAVVKEEDDESWSWFMRWLRLEVVGPHPLCVISGWQDPLLRLFDQPDSGWCTSMGQAFHRYCSRYLCENMCSSFKKDYLVKWVKWVLRQNQQHKFHQGMLRILESNRKAYNWLIKVGTRPNEENAYHVWSLCEDGGHRYGVMAMNGKECVFNSFPKIQKLPIAALVELTFTKSAETFASKREAASKIEAEKQLWSNKVMATLEARRAKMRQHKVVSIQSEGILHDEFEVETKSKVKHTIRISGEQRSCSCQKPQLTGIPCSHLLAVCAFRSLNADHMVDDAYSVRQLLATWAPQFHSAGSMEEWPDYAGVSYSPDCKSVKAGRRKNVSSPRVPGKLKRLREHHCSLCGQNGHYKVSCSRKQGNEGSTSES